MRPIKYIISCCAALSLLVAGCGKTEHADSSNSMAETTNVSAQAAFTVAELSQRAIERRAIEAVIWGMPAVNYDRMFEASRAAGAGPNQIAYWSRPLSWLNQTLTPNPNTIYLMPFIDTTSVGPMVMEIPPAEGGAIVGSLMDVWQVPIEDVGIAGVDKGQGGKYLILPPDYEGSVPDGYIPMPSSTFQTYGLLRSNIADDSDAGIAKSVEYARQIKLYPLSQAADAPPTKFVDAIDELYDATIPYDLRYFESLNRIVQTEPWLGRDKTMIDKLRSIGIEKGKPFNPDEETKRILNGSMAEARAWIDAQYVAGYANTFNEGTHWALPVFPIFYPEAQKGYTDRDAYSVDARGVTYSFIFFAPKHLGKGQFYFFSILDDKGNDLEGGSTYRLRVPANAPVRQYWSVVAYDRETHALIRDMPRSSRASNIPEVEQNPDGSVDIWFGPESPKGKESNWIPTNKDGRFELVFRAYGPEPPLFNKTWVLPDLEKTK
jgi:hypothetical protein